MPFSCDPEVDWMHCDQIVNEYGSWPQSWMALERAYAEGFIASLGVSNFDVDLLNMLLEHGFHMPHAVQNFADLEDVDMDVRVWCSEHDVVFVPYASRRHVEHLSQELTLALTELAERYGVSKHVIVSKFFLQTGAAAIPRTSNVEHLVENIQKIYDFVLTESELESLGWIYGVNRAEEL